MTRLPGLDALRGVAALIVTARHFQQEFRLTELPISASLSVYVFFTLSGFVMALTYESQFRAGLTTPSFLKLRYRRLFLPVAVGTLIGALLIVTRSGLTVDLLFAIFAALLFMPAAWLRHAFLFNPPAWSLFIEIICNALHPKLIAQTRLLAAAIALCFALWAVFAVVGLGRWHPGAAGILTMLPGGLGCYLIGVHIFRRYGERALGATGLGGIVALVFASVGVWLLPMTFEPALTLLACPLILLLSMPMPESRLAVWVGALSFPLYSTHVPVIRAAQALGANIYLTVPIVLAVAMVTGWCATSLQKKSAKSLA